MQDEWPTDEDRQIARLIIHRNLVGWLIQALSEAGIMAIRTSGNDKDGDVQLLRTEDVAPAKAKLRAIQSSLHGYTAAPTTQAAESVYIEIKAYTKTPITSGLARKLIQKSTVLGVVTTASITQPAKTLMDKADIAWVENFPQTIVE